MSNFLRSSRAAPLHVGRQKPRKSIQPRLVDLKKRSIHQAWHLRSEKEVRGGVPEMFEKYMDSCMLPNLQFTKHGSSEVKTISSILINK